VSADLVVNACARKNLWRGRLKPRTRGEDAEKASACDAMPVRKLVICKFSTAKIQTEHRARRKPVTSTQASEQSVNNSLPNTRYQQGPIRATHTKSQRGQTPALTYEPGGRTFESCWAHQINNLQPLFCLARPVVKN
jgi:hypothetical protein